MTTRVRVRITGTVQGVGFRPFVYGVATRLGLAGAVGNDTRGVWIEAEGTSDAVAALLVAVRDEAPPLAVVDDVVAVPVPVTGAAGFAIAQSAASGAVATAVPPDTATCDDCLRELWDASDRRHLYPFINCTNCGPRFTIVTGIPYDRPLTTMAAFPMCPDCTREYHDPTNRRFHAQPTCCPTCGPHLTLRSPDGSPLPPHPPPDPTAPTPHPPPDPTAAADPPRPAPDPAAATIHSAPAAAAPTTPQPPPDPRAVYGPPTSFQHFLGIPGFSWNEVGDAGADVAAIAGAAGLLLGGAVVAVKGLGGYHLAAVADDAGAVGRLRARKHREDKPFAVMVGDLEGARALCEVDAVAEAELTGPRRPIVLLPRRVGAAVAEGVAPGAHELGVMLPYTPLHHLLLAAVGRPLVMTSGNVSDEPIAYRDEEAAERLAAIADAFLVHDRPIHTRVDDSVVRVVRGAVQPVRRSRGYVPGPLRLPVAAARPVLAVGAELKSTFCLVRGDTAVVSHHIGDLENLETYRAFTEGIALLGALVDVEPEVVAHDLHPEYLSTKYAHDAHRRRRGRRAAPPRARRVVPGGQRRDRPRDRRRVRRPRLRDSTAPSGAASGWSPTSTASPARATWRPCRSPAALPRSASPGAWRSPTWRQPAWPMPRCPIADRHEADWPRVRAVARSVLTTSHLQRRPPLRRGRRDPRPLRRGHLRRPGRDRAGAHRRPHRPRRLPGRAVRRLQRPATPHPAARTPSASASTLPVAGWAFQARGADLLAAVVEDVRAGVERGTIAARFHAGVAAAVVEGCERVREATGMRPRGALGRGLPERAAGLAGRARPRGRELHGADAPAGAVQRRGDQPRAGRGRGRRLRVGPGLTAYPQPVAELPLLWVTAGLSCDGDSIALTAATQPSLEDLVLGRLPGVPKLRLYHPTLALEVGDAFLEVFRLAAAGELEHFVLVVEGSIPDEERSGDGCFAGLGTDHATGQPIPTTQWLERPHPARRRGRRDGHRARLTAGSTPCSATPPARWAWRTTSAAGGGRGRACRSSTSAAARCGPTTSPRRCCTCCA